jgi:hypothetical protein
MRKSIVFTALAATAFATVPSSATLLGVGSLAAAVSLMAGSDATARTAVLPGWRHPCGRNPRCFERAEARRQAKLRAQSTPAP